MFQEYMSVIKKSNIFTGFSVAEIGAFLNGAYDADQAELKTVPSDTYIVEHGGQISMLTVILDGQVSALCNSFDGNQNLYNIFGPGDTFGAFVNYLSESISPIAYMSTKKTIILTIEADYCLNVFGKEQLQRFLLNVMNIMGQEQKESINRMKILSKKSLRTRILMYLKMESKRNANEDGTFKVRFNQGQMAKYLCVNRSALSHELSVLQQEEYISYKGKNFALHGKSEVEKFCYIGEDMNACH